MTRLDIDILGISELKWTGMGEFNSDDHQVYYCGQESLRRNGVAFTVNKRVGKAVLGYNLHNDRMISVRIQGKPFNITAVQVYAPTTGAEEAEVDRFYEGLQHLLELTPKNDVADLRQGQRERVKIHCWLGRKQAAEPGAKSPLFPFSHLRDSLFDNTVVAMELKAIRSATYRCIPEWSFEQISGCAGACFELRSRSTGVQEPRAAPEPQVAAVARTGCEEAPAATNDFVYVPGRPEKGAGTTAAPCGLGAARVGARKRLD
ncbi:Craniofacial development protein 2 [Varanus komodoensis]|nr:Craniofacial development protein 2 [Varanus komodoensis]